jgi:hypothetical protein
MAVGLVATRQDLDAFFTSPKDFRIFSREFIAWMNPILLIKAVIFEVWLMAWTAGWLALQLRQPRPRFRQLSRQPGFLACFSSVVITLVSGPLIWTFIICTSNGANGWLDRVVWGEMVSSQIGAAVLAGWSLLVAGRRCRMRTGWLDRVGQLLGLIWVVMLPANLVHFFWHGLPDGGWSN